MIDGTSIGQVTLFGRLDIRRVTVSMSPELLNDRNVIVDKTGLLLQIWWLAKAQLSSIVMSAGFMKPPEGVHIVS
jgi:hypothetical protein